MGRDTALTENHHQQPLRVGTAAAKPNGSDAAAAPGDRLKQANTTLSLPSDLPTNHSYCTALMICNTLVLWSPAAPHLSIHTAELQV